MRLKGDLKAVSTIISIILILVSLIVGGLISYIWVMSNFYFEPSTVNMEMTDLVFPVENAGYFNVTLAVPSSSMTAVNVTDIFLAPTGVANLSQVTNTDPDLPVLIDKASSKTIMCNFNWTDFVGQNVTVYAETENGAATANSAVTPFVQLTISTSFNATDSVEYFEVTASNSDNSSIDLNITKVLFALETLQNFSKPLPLVVPRGESVTFRCFYNWEGRSLQVITVQTAQGYYGRSITDAGATVLLQVTDVSFNETDPTKISATLSNSNESVTLVTVTNITVAYADKLDVITGSNSSPAFPQPIAAGSNATFTCAWNWTAAAFRNTEVVVTAYTKQGFVSTQLPVVTPPQVSATISEVVFDTADTGSFSLNVTSQEYSLYPINLTRVELDQNVTTINQVALAPGDTALMVCTFNWSSMTGDNSVINITYSYTSANINGTVQYSLRLPYYRVSNVSFLTSPLGTPYFNMTFSTSEFAKTSANITQIFVKIGNTTSVIDGTIASPTISQSGYVVAKGTDVMIICPWNWNTFVNTSATIIVQTSDGAQASIRMTITA